MAFGTPTRQITGSSKTAATSLAVTAAPAAQINSGDVIFVVVASDNVTTTDGNTTDHASVSVSATGRTTTNLTKGRESTNGQGAAAGGATVSIWYGIAADTYLTSDSVSVTASFGTNSITAKALLAYSVTKGAGTTLNLDGGADAVADAVAHPAINISGLSNIEHLFIQGWADEAALGSTTPTITNGTALGASVGTAGGSAATNMTVDGGYRVFTGTSNNMTVSFSNVDAAGTYIAISEVAAGNNWTANPSDSTAVSDSLTSFGWGPGIGDTTSLSDGISKQETKELVPADSTALADAQAFDFSKSGLADSSAPSDATTPERGINTSASDSTAGVSDAITSFGRGPGINDTETPTDAIDHFDLGEGVGDSTSATDAIDHFDLGEGVGDSISATDTQTLGYGPALADALALADSITSFGYGPGLADSTAISDAATASRDIQQPVSDSATATDAQAYARGIAQSLSDSVTPSDTVTVGQILAQAVADSLTLSDALSTAQAFNLNPADVQTLSDALVTAQAFSRTLADSLAMSDNVYFDRTQAVADAVTLADQQSKGIGTEFADALVLLDDTATALDLAIQIADAAVGTDVVVAFLPTQGAPYVHSELPNQGFVVSEAHAGGTIILQVSEGEVLVYQPEAFVTEAHAKGDQE